MYVKGERYIEVHFSSSVYNSTGLNTTITMLEEWTVVTARYKGHVFVCVGVGVAGFS